MTPVKSQKTTGETLKMESIVLLWAAIRALLEEKKARINEEIVNYPPPIPACDQYFNYLLQERATIPQELFRLDAISDTGATPEEQIRLLEAFIEASSHLTDEERRHVLAAVKEMRLAPDS